MKTIWLLAARHEGLVVIPIDKVRQDYFSHLTTDHLIRKISTGEIDLPLVRMEASQKAAKGVALVDLAAYIDRKIADARDENDKMLNRNPLARP